MPNVSRLLAPAYMACFATAFGLLGCTVIEGNTFKNEIRDTALDVKSESVCKNPQYVSRARVTNGMEPPQRCRDDLRDTFVGIAISGGGSRAANFSLGVLAELEKLGMLDHVSAISAVSGGTLAASYFALNGEKKEWSDRATEVFKKDLLGSWIAKNLNPVNLVRTLTTNEDRTDLLAETFVENLFEGRSHRFGELQQIGPRRPALLLSATALTDSGSRFVFTEDSFRRIGSRLDSYPIANAMAASAAFPAVMNAATLKNFSGGVDATATNSRYVHLIDGGPSDNLGVGALVDYAKGYFARARNFNLPMKGCFIFVVDAGLPITGEQYRTMPDRRSVLSHLVDLDFFDAIDIMLWHQRRSSLAELNIYPRRLTDTPQFVPRDGRPARSIEPYNRIADATVKLYSERQADGRSGVTTQPRTRGWTIGPDRPEIQVSEQEIPVNCKIWHIPLDGVKDIEPWTSLNGDEPSYNYPNQLSGNTAIQSRINLWEVATRVETNFRLTGPKGCDADALQKVLFDSARVLVAEDHVSRPKACKWFRENGLSVNEATCGKTPKSLIYTDKCSQ